MTDKHRHVVTFALIFLCTGLSCVGGTRTHHLSYNFFGHLDQKDKWSDKIERWQVRQTRDEQGRIARHRRSNYSQKWVEEEPLVIVGATLAQKYEAFRLNHPRAVSQELTLWIQEQARFHFIPDGPEGLPDVWATLGETLRRNGDDCDGLELLVYYHLIDLGFEHVYRAIMREVASDNHHMVTLWFEDTSDPWMIDPTGAIVSNLARLSEVPGWELVKIFTEEEEFTPKRALLKLAH